MMAESPVVDPIDERYELHKKNGYTGRAVIISNDKFKVEKLKYRKGADKDVNIMKEALEGLDFDVVVHRNQTGKQMITLFSSIQEKCSAEYDCFVAVIMSHGGDKDIIYGHDDEEVELNELIELLLPEKFSQMKGKPKLFFVQACRGTKFDKGNSEPDGIETPHQVIKYPRWADVLIHNSTGPTFYAWENDGGSWFIQTLGKVLKDYGQQKELTEMLTLVNRKVAQEYESHVPTADEFSGMKQMPAFTFMLTKKFYFN